MDAVHIPEWIAKIKQADGALLMSRGCYLSRDHGSDVVQIDGYLTSRDLRELADYIDHELGGRA